ncbi:hypothetical protein AcV7_007503 [Taiwanofungus camphoratus]|nr:hypothetical protein AcV7_007503 [Antrodia cinnamomea]
MIKLSCASRFEVTWLHALSMIFALSPFSLRCQAWEWHIKLFYIYNSRFILPAPNMSYPPSVFYISPPDTLPQPCEQVEPHRVHAQKAKSPFSNVLSGSDHAKLAREGDWKFMWERLGNFPLQPREYTLTQLPVSGAPAHSIRFTGPQAFPQGVSMTECMEGGRMLNGDELIQEFGELEHIELWINWPTCPDWSTPICVSSAMSRRGLAKVIAQQYHDFIENHEYHLYYDNPNKLSLTGINFRQLHLVELCSADGTNWEATVSVWTIAP